MRSRRQYREPSAWEIAHVLRRALEPTKVKLREDGYYVTITADGKGGVTVDGTLAEEVFVVQTRIDETCVFRGPWI